VYRETRSRLQRLRAGDEDAQVFDRIIAENRWQDPDSASGTGSNLKQTETLRRELPGILSRLQVRTLLDAPCGDFHWMQHVELDGIAYTGLDVVASVIERCQACFASPSRQFLCRNILTDALPQADAILSRDCLSHLANEQVFAALRNFRSSGAIWILATTYPSRVRNWDIVSGNWRPINLCAAPFGFPPPVDALIEGSTEYDGDFADKTLAVWRFSALPLR
jgi:2-polyprenyl-3-methyl-5-hydroxy-6-metoxy-1,4-benzoquinol methylase